VILVIFTIKTLKKFKDGLDNDAVTLKVFTSRISKNNIKYEKTLNDNYKLFRAFAER